MGWTIQHIPGRTENRPYTLVADAAVSKLRWRPNGRQYLPFLRDLAEAADTAARSGKPWRWS